MMRRRVSAGISSVGVAELYFDSYDADYASGKFDVAPENMVDGDEDVYAIANLDNSEQYQLLDDIAGSLGSGTITTVDMRVKCYYSNKTAAAIQFYFGPYQSEENYVNKLTTITDTPTWSDWLEVSLVAGPTWDAIESWEDLASLKARIYTLAAGPEGTRYADVHVSKVEMRVTYT